MQTEDKLHRQIGGYVNSPTGRGYQFLRLSDHRPKQPESPVLIGIILKKFILNSIKFPQFIKKLLNRKAIRRLEKTVMFH